MTRRDVVRGAALATAALAAPSFLPGCGSASTAPSLDGSEPIAQDLRDLGIGGVVLFDRDVLQKAWGRIVTSAEQLTGLTAAARRLSRTQPFIAVDQEGGNVARLKPSCGFPATVTAKSLGDLNDLGVTRLHATSIAATLLENGLDVNFAPVVDLNVNPDSPAIGRHGRSFSADPAVVVILVGNNLAYDPDVAPRTIELVARRVRDGIVPESRIDDSWTRIQKAKGQFAPPVT